MREPYTTLFAGFESHWMLGRHLRGDVPDWDGIVGSDRFSDLSSGEVVLVRVGLAIWNGCRDAAVADLAVLDESHRRQVLAALEACG